MQTKFKYKKGITHGGSAFHSDDVFATALCKYFAEKEGHIFETTRQNNVTKEEINNPDIIIYDIGKLYSPELGVFDHHQSDTPTREDGQRYSACGLVLREFGNIYFSERELKNMEKITTLIDYHDNGKLILGESNPEEFYEFSAFSPTWNESPELQHEYFEKAVETALKVIKLEVDLANGISNPDLEYEINKELLARDKIQKDALAAAEKVAVNSLDTLNNGIITLPKFVPVRDFYADPEFLTENNVKDIYFIVYPGDRDPYSMQLVPQEPKIFELKIPDGFNIVLDKDEDGKNILPEGIIFVHSTGFFAACETYEAAIDLANRTLERHLENISVEEIEK